MDASLRIALAIGKLGAKAEDKFWQKRTTEIKEYL